MANSNLIFGPVNSRRFGASLGIDLSPSLKQCNFDCLYCELAPAPTVAHQNSTISVNALIEALSIALEVHPTIDVITVTANGEPTLYPHLDELVTRVDAIKGDKETLILTNSAALVDENVFKTLLRFDRVKLSLDAVTAEIFKKIDRPHEGIDVDAIAKRVIAFSQRFSGKLYIEILFVHGLNDTPEEIAALNAVLRQVKAERIDLGSIDRPPAYPVQGLSFSELHACALRFDPELPVHIASRQHAEMVAQSYSDEEIVNTLDKRPLTRDDIAHLFDAPSQARLKALEASGIICEKPLGALAFLMPCKNIARKRRKS